MHMCVFHAQTSIHFKVHFSFMQHVELKLWRSFFESFTNLQKCTKTSLIDEKHSICKCIFVNFFNFWNSLKSVARFGQKLYKCCIHVQHYQRIVSKRCYLLKSIISFLSKCLNKSDNLPVLIFTSKIMPNTVIFPVGYFNVNAQNYHIPIKLILR